MTMIGYLQRYMNSGQLVEIIYLDRHGRTSKRTVRIHEISRGRVKAYCFARRAFRIFSVDNILAAVPVVKQRAAGY
jgi:predicted DNA-binding transcriptional regulator YafY